MSSFNYKKFSLNFNALFNGYRYVLGENIYQNMIPSWWVCDVSAVYDFSFKKYTFKMKGEINNLFDTHYEVIRSFPMPGRSYYFNMTIIY
jgi:outer membrane cobalamin receptor